MKHLDGFILRGPDAGYDFRRAGNVGSGAMAHHARAARSGEEGNKVATSEWAHVCSKFKAFEEV